MNENQKGFSAVEVLIVIIVVGLIGSGGWYVWKSRKNNQTPAPVATSSNSTTEEPKNNGVDEVAQSWLLVESQNGGFSIRIPDGWTGTNYAESDQVRVNGVTYKAGTKAKITNADTQFASDGLVRFQVVQHNNGVMNLALDGKEKKSKFVAGSLKGTKYYWKVSENKIIQGVGDPIPGSEEYTYVFRGAKKTTYVFYTVLNYNKNTAKFLKTNYNQTTSDKNQVSLVEQSIKTLKIN